MHTASHADFGGDLLITFIVGLKSNCFSHREAKYCPKISVLARSSRRLLRYSNAEYMWVCTLTFLGMMRKRWGTEIHILQYPIRTAGKTVWNPTFVSSIPTAVTSSSCFDSHTRQVMLPMP